MKASEPAAGTTRGLAQLVVRVLKGVGHASIFLFLALPLVTLNTCAGPIAEFSGYQALTGVTVPAAAFGLSPTDIPDYGHDWWVAGLMVLALVGIGAALRGGLPGALIGVGVGVAGLISLQPAISFFNPPPGGMRYWSSESGSGGNGIGIVFFGVLIVDLVWVATRSGSEYRRTEHAPASNRGDWFALALASISFLVLIGLGLLAVGVLVLLTAH